MNEGIYLFCFTENAAAQNLDGGVFFIDCGGGIAAAAKLIQIGEFTDEKNLENPEWLLPLVLEHERMIEKINAFAPVFPAAFGSLFAVEASLQQVAEQNNETILNFLNETRGCREYSVKGYLSRQTAQHHILRENLNAEATELNSLPAGKRFFAEKKLIERAAQIVNQEVEAICAVLAEAAEQNSRQSCERKIVVDKTDEREQILNWALLLDETQIIEIENLCAEYNERYAAFGLGWQLAGAFPPFSFVPKLTADAI